MVRSDMQKSCVRILQVVLAILPVAQLAGCGVGYYWQATMGHMELMRQSRPVADVVADTATSAETRAGLEAANRAVEFAHRELLLPDNGSYSSYADTGRRYVVWNVFAAPEFSLDARSWCFPVAGCVSYRGYFDAANARAFAAGRAEQGDDVFVGGVAAYSTLGRFADPLLNTMMGFPDYRLAGLVFHELAHQRIYVKGDTRFNEGFASFVEEEGVRRWLSSQHDASSLKNYDLTQERLARVRALFAEARGSLAELYDQDIAADLKRDHKKTVFSKLRQAYAGLRASWAGPPYFDQLFDGPLNNARMVAMATYDDYVPAFHALLVQQGGDLRAFYTRVAEIASLGADQRAGELAALSGSAPRSPPRSPDL
jgi:predicted aminopeptidase